MSRSAKHVALLVCVVLVAHFVPPERSAPAPDEMFTASLLQDMGLERLLDAVLGHQRPLFRWLFVLGTALLWNAWWLVVALLAISAVAATLASYFFYRELLQDDNAAAAASVIYALLANKLELFHSGMYAGILAMHALYITAAWLFLRSLRVGGRPALVGSVSAYGAACLMNEVGVLLPLAVAAWAVASRLDGIRRAAWFALPAAFFALRYLETWGETPVLGGVRSFRWDRIPDNLLAAPSFFVGRHMARACVYGLVQFPRIEPAWLAVALVLDAAFVYLVWKWLSRATLPAVPSRLLWASAVAMVAFLVPNLLWFIEDRHTALSDLGFAVLLLPIVKRLCQRPALAAAAFAVLLVVAQGNSWNHVVACRINRAVQQTVEERAAEVRAARLVVFDLASFTESIPYTLTDGARWRNPLASYYGAQVFAPWGLRAIVRLAGGRGRVVASEGPVERVEAGWEYLAWQKEPTRGVAPLDGTLVIDYASVYGCGFERGNRVPCAPVEAPAR